MDKLVVYAGTRNVYEQMYVSLKSLLLNTPVDGVFLFIEDDKFPYPVPENVVAVNVSGQEFFKPGSPNYGSPWSYMDLLRCALGMMLPENIKQVLWLDIDTIVDVDISDLFEIDMTGFFFAGAFEPNKSHNLFRYINTGVTIHNLELLRAWNKEAEMVSFLNAYKFGFPGQDVINLLAQGRIKLIDSEYNQNEFVLPCVRPKIIHYAAMKADEYKKHWAYKKYEQMNLEVKTDDK